MLTEWRRFKGWEILEFFLRKPNTEIHISGLAKELNISKRTSENYLKLYRKMNILKYKNIANATIFYLNNADILVKQLKKAYLLMILKELEFIDKLLSENPNISNIVIYGSYANGEYSEESDIDFLIISQNKINLDLFEYLEKKLNKKVEVVDFTIGKWRELARKKDRFYKSVLNNHINVYGEI